MNCILCECDISEFYSDNTDENVFCKDCGLFFLGPNFDGEQDLIDWVNSKKTDSKAHFLHSYYLANFYQLKPNNLTEKQQIMLQNIVKYLGKRGFFKTTTTQTCMCCEESEVFNNSFKCSICGNDKDYAFYLINYIDLSKQE